MRSIGLFLREFSEQYCDLIAQEESLVSLGKPVSEWKHKETFKQFQILMGAFATYEQNATQISEKCLGSQHHGSKLSHRDLVVYPCDRHGGPEKSTSLRHMGERCEIIC